MNNVDSNVVNEHDCIKCGYHWVSTRSNFIPKECPNCKSRKWKAKVDVAPPHHTEHQKPDIPTPVSTQIPPVHDSLHDDEEFGEFIPDRYRITEH